MLDKCMYSIWKLFRKMIGKIPKSWERLLRPMLEGIWAFSGSVYTGYIYNRYLKPLLDIEYLDRCISTIKSGVSSESSKNIYCIKVSLGKCGLFSIVNIVFSQIAYALSKGFIPVIDMQNETSIYLDIKMLGKENAWEYYFRQPYDLNLDSIKGDEYKKFFPVRVWPWILYENYNEVAITNLWCRLYREFFKLNPHVEQYINETYDKLISPNMRVIGVFCRGTDYIMRRPRGHRIQPRAEQAIEKARQFLVEWNCDYIYLTTEDQHIFRLFSEAFPKKLLVVPQLYYNAEDCGDKMIGEMEFDRENDAYLRGLEYLTSIVILSRCNCLLGGVANGSISALYMNDGKYENKYFFELGKYGIDQT